MQALAADIKQNAKAKELLGGLKQGFARLKELGAKQKALIFTENRTTQDFLFSLLDSGPYKGKVLTYNGSRTRDYSVMERFEKEARILISTDIGAEGFNLEFCSFVINYDLPYITLTIEQRINRCHRQGQQSDVIILNFLNKNNFADVRLLQLINKRILQFSGMSDDVIGNFGIDLGSGFSKVLGKARTREEIDRAYQDALERFEEENKQLVRQRSPGKSRKKSGSPRSIPSIHSPGKPVRAALFPMTSARISWRCRGSISQRMGILWVGKTAI